MASETVIDPRLYDAVILDFDDAVAAATAEAAATLISDLQRAGVGTAVTPRATGLSTSVTARVDGVTTRAADSLHTSPDRCVVIADAPSAIAVGRDGGFGWVIAVDDGTRTDQLLHAGADVVVADLREVVVRPGTRPMSALPDALQSYQQVVSVLESRRPVVFCDFDGTLSAIVDDPDSATLIFGAADALKALAELCPVAVLSGRDLADIQQRVGLAGIWYAGSHGFELSAPDGTCHQNESAAAAVDVLAGAAAELRAQLGDVEGVMVEHKRFAVAVHYRNAAPDRVNRVTAMVHKLASRSGLRVTGGRKVVELRPNVAWDKGKTLGWILQRLAGLGPLLPIYLGDDLIDEDAFDAVRRGGVGIVVRHGEHGDRKSSAGFSLENPGAVGTFIKRLARRLAEEQKSATNPWSLTFGGYNPADERLREALCVMGNGYIATRGTAPESSAGDAHYPGTYRAGLYNRLADHIAGSTVTNESLVNLPNWLPLTFRIDGGPWFDVDTVELVSYLQTLDLRRAMLTREFVFRDRAGRTTSVIQRRFVSMDLPHVCALETTVVAKDWSGTVEFRSVIDGDVRNSGVERYRELSSRHLAVTQSRELSGDSVLLAAQTVESQVSVALAARTTLWRGDAAVPAEYRLTQDSSRIGHDITVALGAGESVTVEKVATVFTGRDPAISQPAEEAESLLQRAGRFTDLLPGHELAWAHLWGRFDFDMSGDADALRIVRLHLLHLLQTVSPHTSELDAGVPARGLHGEAYRGHVFWDDVFVFPLLNIHLPKVTRSLLHYRYRRLPQARDAARAAGHAGAMFPWQSGSDGREESQRLHLNPRSGRWNPDASARAHHVGSAVAYNIWQYYQVTGDVSYLIDYGAEMLAEIARFWVSLASFDPVRQRYVIRGVIGPDEFHSGYPGRIYDGVDNNAYTNVMAVWTIMRAMDAMEALPLHYRLDLLETLGLDGRELDLWEDVSRRMFVPFHDGVISQFEGYSDLRELDWHAYRHRYGNIQRLDRILEAENDDVNNYKVCKQADVLMLFYLLSADELRELFGRLGYRFTPDQIPATVEYYRKRTSHGSTLSAVVHSWVLARGNRERAMDYFQLALYSDVTDIQRGTTAEGIHLAAMTGSVDLLQRCFTGLEFRADRIVLAPLWPETLGPLAFSFQYRAQRLHLCVTGTRAEITAYSEQSEGIDVECRGRVQRLMPGHNVEFA